MVEERFRQLYEKAKREVDEDELDDGMPIDISIGLNDGEGYDNLAEIVISQKGEIHPIQMVMMKHVVEEAIHDLFQTCALYDENGEKLE